MNPIFQASAASADGASADDRDDGKDGTAAAAGVGAVTATAAAAATAAAVAGAGKVPPCVTCPLICLRKASKLTNVGDGLHWLQRIPSSGGEEGMIGQGNPVPDPGCWFSELLLNREEDERDEEDEDTDDPDAGMWLCLCITLEFMSRVMEG